MSASRKVFAFDFFLLKKERLFLPLILVLLLACLLYALSAFYSPSSALEIPDRAQALSSYQTRVNFLDDLLASGQLSPSETLAVQGEIRLLSFYLSTGSIKTDYVDPGELTSLGSPYQGVAFAFKNVAIAFPFMALFAPLVFYRTLFSHGAMGAKAFAMAPIEKKTAFRANALFALMIVAIPFLLFFLLSLIGILASGNPRILYDSGVAYQVVPASFLLLSLALSLAAYILFLWAVSFLAYRLFHQDYIALASPALLSLIFLALFALLSLSLPNLNALEKSPWAAYFPLLSLYHLAFYPLAYPYWLALGLHLLGAGLLFTLTYRHYAKEGYPL